MMNSTDNYVRNYLLKSNVLTTNANEKDKNQRGKRPIEKPSKNWDDIFE